MDNTGYIEKEIFNLIFSILNTKEFKDYVIAFDILKSDQDLKINIDSYIKYIKKDRKKIANWENAKLRINHKIDIFNFLSRTNTLETWSQEKINKLNRLLETINQNIKYINIQLATRINFLKTTKLYNDENCSNDNFFTNIKTAIKHKINLSAQSEKIKKRKLQILIIKKYLKDDYAIFTNNNVKLEEYSQWADKVIEGCNFIYNKDRNTKALLLSDIVSALIFEITPRGTIESLDSLEKDSCNCFSLLSNFFRNKKIALDHLQKEGGNWTEISLLESDKNSEKEIELKNIEPLDFEMPTSTSRLNNYLDTFKTDIHLKSKISKKSKDNLQDEENSMDISLLKNNTDEESVDKQNSENNTVTNSSSSKSSNKKIIDEIFSKVFGTKK